MNSIQSIQLFVSVNLIVLGLSHFLQPKIWIAFFEFLSKKGHVGNIFNALLALGTGSIIVSFHFVWTWPMVLVTSYGTALVFKGLIYLIFPALGLKSISSVKTTTHKFRWVGLVMSVLSILLIIHLFRNGAFGLY